MSGDSVPARAPLVVNGWSIYAHPLFLDQLEGLIEEVEARKARDPKTWRKKNPTKRLAAIFKLVNYAVQIEGSQPPHCPASKSWKTVSIGCIFKAPAVL